MKHRHTSLSLRTQLSAVAESLEACDAADPYALQRLGQQIVRLRTLMERDQSAEVVPACTLALRVTELLQQSQPIGAKPALEILTGLLGVICGVLGVDGVVDIPGEKAGAATGTASAVAEKAPAKEPPVARVLARTTKAPSLKLVSSRKLGEMLVQMSLLTPAQVEQALNHQRMSGCRFGEALVQMRILSKEAVESALRMQDARKGPNGPWSSR